MPRAKPEKVNRLSAKESWALLNHVQSNYAASEQNNTKFAQEATLKLGFPCTIHNVEGACETLEIPNNLTRIRGESDDATTALQSLTRRVTALEDRVNIYLKGSRGDKA